ncbi:MAG: N-acetylmuramoyl-L-alanine amidase [Planctomycetes bacterium]|nr:N-acetylmuramoyl-L-alanine amidase [Planctomycetota bacterium]
MACRTRAPVWLLACCLAIVAAGCKVPRSQQRSSFRNAREQSAASFEYAARHASSARLEAQNYLAAARLYLDAGDFETAIARISAARQADYTADTAGEINRLLGEAYLEMGQFNLAERYLIKGIPDTAGTERQETLARLVLCARARSDYHQAAEYLSDLGVPYFYARCAEDRSSGVAEASRAALSPRTVEILERDVHPAPWDSAPKTLSGMLSRSPETTGAQPPGEPQRPAASEPLARWDGSQLQILPRWRWNASPIKGNVDLMKRPTRITVHHSGPPKCIWTQDPRETAAIIRGIQRYHQRTRGWADIGYHFVIDRAGSIWQGRPLHFQGAHAGDGQTNSRNIGIVLLGDYGLQKQKLTMEQRQSLLAFLALLSHHYEIPTDQIYTHAEIAPRHTECPGPEITLLVHSIRRYLKEQQLLAHQVGGN